MKHSCKKYFLMLLSSMLTMSMLFGHPVTMAAQETDDVFITENTDEEESDRTEPDEEESDRTEPDEEEIGKDPGSQVEIQAARLDYQPYPNIQYDYSAGVSCGTIRYINQIVNGSYWNDAYWGRWKSSAYQECGTSSLSMALSYIGINKTPDEILTAKNGITYWDCWGAVYETGNCTALMDRYINGNGKYSPVMVQVPSHYFLLIGRINGNSYAAIDPDNLGRTQVEVNGNTLRVLNRGSWKTVSLISAAQWYNANASIGYNPVGYVDSAEGQKGAVRVTGWAQDYDTPNEAVIIDVYIGGESGSGTRIGRFPADKYREDVGSHGYSEVLPTDLTGSQPFYVYALNRGPGNDNPCIGSGTVEISVNNAPDISNIKITNVSADGYDISADITDDRSISKVRFPTWTLENGQDDLDQPWADIDTYAGVQNGNNWSFHVNTADHNNETGIYQCHIYAWDDLGKVTALRTTVQVGNNPQQTMNYTQTVTKTFNNHKYLLFEERLHWTEASTYCQSLGGHLVSISNAAEDAFVKDMITSRNLRNCFIGLNDMAKEGDFVWDNNEKVTYNNWAGGEPDNYGGNQDYGVMQNDGFWDDIDCDGGYSFILEYDNYCDHQYEEFDITDSCLTNRTIKKVCKLCKNEEIVTDPDQWGEWSTNIPDPLEKNRTESKTQHRYRKIKTVETTDGSLTGYISRKTETRYGNWSGWSGWSPNYVGESDVCQVETGKIFRYYYFLCPVCGGHEPFQGKSDCGKYSLTLNNAHEGWFTTPYSSCIYHKYNYTTARYYTESLGDGQRWNFAAANLNDTAIGTKDDGSDAIVIRQGYRTRTRSKQTVYIYQFLDEWTDWSDEVDTSDQVQETDTRVLYRVNEAVKGQHAWDEGRVIEEPSTEHTGKKEYECTVCHSIKVETLPALEKTDLSKATISSSVNSLVWDGKKKVPDVKVELEGKTLVAGTDYQVDYYNNVEPGTMNALIKGIGKYTGEARKNWVIEKAESTLRKGTNQKDSISLVVGDSIHLTYLADSPITYSVSDKAIATISSDGTVNGLKAGETTVLIRTAENNHYKEKELHCLIKVENRNEPEPEGPEIHLGCVTAVKGETITIPVSISGNEGIAGFALQFSFDKNVFTNPRIDNKTWTGFWEDNNQTTYNVFWIDLEDHAVNGHVFDLLLDVAENAEDGDYPISITYDQDNTFNDQQEDVVLHFDNGSVKLTSRLIGDVNQDGKVNNRDAQLIYRYSAGKINLTAEQLKVADYNDDKKVNNRDALAIFRMAAGK